MRKTPNSIFGVFGKLPRYGDFLNRDLPAHYIDVWDSWLQGYVSGSQEQLGEHWLEIYLTSPIWRFTLSPGVIDDQVWLGVMLPSVDRVGRYFPFSVVCALQTDLPATVINEQAASWFESVEDILFNALEGSLELDELLALIKSLPLSVEGSYQVNVSSDMTVGTIVRSEILCNTSQIYPLLLDASLQQLHTSYSIWSTTGSQYVEPCMFVCKSLPAISGVAAMLDGDWAQSQWSDALWVATPTDVSDDSMNLSNTDLLNKKDESKNTASSLVSDSSYIPNDFLREDVLSQSSKAVSNTAIQPSAIDSLRGLPPSPDITQPRPIQVEQDNIQPKKDNVIQKNTQRVSSFNSGVAPVNPFDVIKSEDIIPVALDSKAKKNHSSDEINTVDPFKNSSSIPLDTDDFKISGIDASSIEISDADPFS